MRYRPLFAAGLLTAALATGCAGADPTPDVPLDEMEGEDEEFPAEPGDAGEVNGFEEDDS